MLRGVTTQPPGSAGSFSSLTISAQPFASLPAASAAVVGAEYRVSDIGSAAGSLWWSDGAMWRAVTGRVSLMQAGLPIGIPPNGSFANNGALSGLATSLPTTYSGGCYLYFPANAIGTGVPAGLYYTVMTNGSAGTVYNNTYTSGRPAAPASNTPFVTTGPGAYTQTVSTDITVNTFTLPGNAMGLNGSFYGFLMTQTANNANNKTVKLKFGSTTLVQQAQASTTGMRLEPSIQNMGVANMQVAPGASSGLSYGPNTTTGVAFMYSTEDTTQNVTCAVTLQVSVATDYNILSSLTEELYTP